MAKTVLVTGAFGNIGSGIVQHLLKAGHRVVCMDLDTPATQARAAQLGANAKPMLGDIRKREFVEAALQGVEAVVHMAAIIPPGVDANPVLSRAVNVDATRQLIALMEASSTAKRLVFASSVGVTGQAQHLRQPPITGDTPLTPDDEYGRHKAECEGFVRASTLQWSILRIAASPPLKSTGGNADTLPLVFDTPPESRIEFVHPDDAALAFANAVDCDAAIGRTLMIGGGKRSQYDALTFYNTMFKALGLGTMPREAFRQGTPKFYGDWVDSTESQRLLKFQRHTMEDFLAGVRREMGVKVHLLGLISPLVKRGMLRKSPHWAARKRA